MAPKRKQAPRPARERGGTACGESEQSRRNHPGAEEEEEGEPGERLAVVSRRTILGWCLAYVGDVWAWHMTGLGGGGSKVTMLN